MATRKQKTKRWHRSHSADRFTKQAQRQGYRSRAVYKLQEIDHRDALIRRGMRVLELGAAPGGWSQYVAEKVGREGHVVAVDLLNMEPVPNVTIITGDFTDTVVRRALFDNIMESDLVLSDMAPNITGIRDIDGARFLDLLESTLNLTEELLKKGGSLLIKVFESPETQTIRSRCAQRFERVSARKPSASRSKSREYYLLARGFGGNPAQDCA